MAKKKSKSGKHQFKKEHKRSENLLLLGTIGIVILVAYGFSLMLEGAPTPEILQQYTMIVDMAKILIGLIGLLFLNRIHEGIIGVEEELD